MSGSSSTLRILTPRVFSPLLEPSRYKGAYGGRGSGKSHFFAEKLIEAAILQPGIRAVCVREVQKSLEQSVKRLIEDKIQALGVGRYFRILQTEIETHGDGLIIFQGMQNHTAESIKSLEGYDLAWCEEAQSLSQRSLDMLRPTIRKPGSELWFSWNPTRKNDPVDVLLRGGSLPPDATVIEVNWRDNPWFPEVLRAEKDYDQRRDPDKYAHIWLGEYQRNSETRVFRNWRIDEIKRPKDARPYYGGDWGFATDPTVLVRCWLWERTLYIDQEAYAIGCEIDYTPALFAGDDKQAPPRWENPKKYPGIPGAYEWPITADSARPETISYMQRKGFRIASALKGPGSLEDGIEFLKNYDIVVHPDCKHAIDELTLYSYKTDKLTEEILPILEDKDNHVIDALRYAVEGVRRAMVFSAEIETFVKDAVVVQSIWRRLAAIEMDTNTLGCLWAAHHLQTDTIYIYDEMLVPRGALAVHAEAIRKRGAWIPVLFDLEGKKRTLDEGANIAMHLNDLMVDMYEMPTDMREALDEIQNRLATGRLIVFGHLQAFLAQYRRYRRNEKHEIVEEDDLLIRCLGVIVGGLSVAKSENHAESDQQGYDPIFEAERGVTGY